METLKNTIKKYLLLYDSLVFSITKIYFITTGFLWILLYLYFRLSRSRSYYVLIDLKEHITLKRLVFSSIFVTIDLSILLTILIEWYRNKFDKKPNLFLVTLSNKLSKIIEVIYWGPLNAIYLKYHRQIPGSGRFFLYLEKSWTDKQRGKSYFYSLVFLFDITPKMIMATVFFIDIVIFGQIKYFFWVVPLVFIPIIFKIFIKLMISFSYNNIPILSNYFSEIIGLGKRKVNIDGTLVSYEKYQYTVKDEYLDVIDPVEEMDYLLQLEHILFYMDQLKRDKEYVELFTTICTSSLYLFAGIVRLLIFYT